MKSYKIRFVLSIAALASIVTIAALGTQAGRSQSQTTETRTTVKPVVRITDVKPVPANAFAIAADLNADLKSNLTWTFGGKQQRGWYLYEALIQRTLNTEADPNSSEFAEALAAWQRPKGLADDGVLNETTLMALVTQWQGSRLKNRAYAQPDQLMTTSALEFYDPERLVELRQVERETYAAYRRMLAAAIADPTLNLAATANGELDATEKYFKVISAFRSREYQEQLRRKSPNAGTAGLAINSPHFTGRALDIYVGGDPVDTRDSNRAIQVKTPVYQWLVRNAERFGFRPYFYEPWHWEYVK